MSTSDPTDTAPRPDHADPPALAASAYCVVHDTDLLTCAAAGRACQPLPPYRPIAEAITYAERATSSGEVAAAAEYGLPPGGDWASWQAGRAWARQREFYGIPRWCSSPVLRGFVMGNALLAPVLIIVWAVLNAT